MMTQSVWLPAIRGTMLVTAVAAVAALAACTEQPGPVAPDSAAAVPTVRAYAAPPPGCRVGDPAFSRDFRNDLNIDFNDYGRILEDADTDACAESAAYALIDKINATLLARPDAFTTFLQGANVAMIFAAANRIGANGFATKELDTQLRRVENSYAFTVSPICSNENNDTCSDDYAVAATGYAWIAAYKFRRGDYTSDVESFRQSARAAIANTFRGLCINRSEGEPSLCNGTVDEIRTGAARTLSLNHGQQMPSYGFGLMANIATAELGLEGSASSYTFSPDERTIANALFEEAQRSISDGAGAAYFNGTCGRPSRDVNGNWRLNPGAADCAGPDNYRPQMYRLDLFYSQYLNGIPNAGTYRSDYFRTSDFSVGPFDYWQFFSFGRYQTFGKLAYDWILTRRAYLPYDHYDPIGYLDAVDANGNAYGWSCDQDAAKRSVRVDFYVGGQFVGYTRAAGGSEPAVNNLCGGGTAHRYSFKLPAWTKGLAVTAYGLDYTWYGATPLTCLQSPRCSW
jgi:hypothetical protein